MSLRGLSNELEQVRIACSTGIVNRSHSELVRLSAGRTSPHCHFIVKGKGKNIVAVTDRVLMLNRTLNKIRDVGFRNVPYLSEPDKIFFDKPQGKLFVADLAEINVFLFQIVHRTAQ